MKNEETLEEVALREYPVCLIENPSCNGYNEPDIIDANESDRGIFIDGGKWQQERMYSEEDLKQAFKVNYTPFSATNIGDFDKDWNRWFKQFKKK
jgi:hypothetical protein